MQMQYFIEEPGRSNITVADISIMSNSTIYV